MVAVEQSAESFGDDHLAVACRWRAVDQLVPESLVWPLRMVVNDVFPKGALELGLPEEDDSIEALRLDRLHPASAMAFMSGAW